MRTYEMMFVLRPDLEEEQVLETKERLQKIIADFGGEFINAADGWGKKLRRTFCATSLFARMKNNGELLYYF